MIRQYLILLLLVSIINPVLRASRTDDYKFNRIDVETGLTNSEVLCIFKDRSGFMWFGTPSGLNRYDGYEVVSYKQDLSTKEELSSNNDIWQIQEDINGRLWLNTRLGYTVYDPAQECFIDSPSTLFKQYAGTEDFWSVYIDEGKNFWFVTWDDIRLYDSRTGNLKIFEQGLSDGLSRGLIAAIKQGKNRYWFLLDNGMLECMDAQTHKVISRDSTILKLSENAIKDQRDMNLFIDSSGDVWVYGVGSHLGVAYYNTSRSTWQVYSTFASPSYRLTSDIIMAIQEDNKGNIWIGTDHGGVNLINKKTGKISYILNDENDPLSLAQNTIKSLYKDDTGIMWLGTYKKGVCYYHESIYKFKSFISSSQIPYKDINCFHETADGNIWIGTNGGGLLFFDRKKGKYTLYKHDPEKADSPSGNVIVSIEEDQAGRLWIGYYLDGLDCFDGNTFTNYNYSPEDPDGLTDNNAWVLKCDKNGDMWIGTLRGGVFVLNVNTGKILKHFETNGSVYSLVERRSGGMFIGAQSGLYLYNPEKDKLELYEQEIFTEVQLSRNDINNMCEDSRGLLWIGTRNGLFVYNPYTREVLSYTEDNGLSADLVQSILEDSDSNMWIATNRGLTCIKVTTNVNTPGYFFKLTNYDSSEGLQGEQFNYNAAYMTSKSELIFGGTSGFNLFIPSQINYNNNSPKVVITDFQIYNKSIKPNKKYHGRILLKNSISVTDKIKLEYSDNYISLTFAALDYCMPNKSRYYYKLEGFNNEWLEADRNSRKATYTNLSPGTYLFNLKAVNNDGIESIDPIKLKIVVSPPFWNTIGAWSLYLLLLIALILWYRKRMTIKAEKKLAYAQEKLKVDQQLEMDEMKLRFFTNISHEFRTPLTLILTPLEELQKKEKDTEKKGLLDVIDRNARGLLRLVNQLLDFRKLDNNAHKLQKSHGDVIQFLKEQATLFNEAMRKKQISFTCNSEVSSLLMWFDADKLGKIMVNLLSNAYKFTPEGGHVSINIEIKDDETLVVTVSDDGIGIPETDLEKIFERFYQVTSKEDINNQGSGIGLHIVKEYVELHGGKVQAKRLQDKGSCFEFILPITAESPENMESETIEDGEYNHEQINQEPPIGDELPKLLIVEDNTELSSFLADQMKNEYTILQASDGVEGQEIAFAEIPDMILSDVMMPRMDGVKLCQTLKADIRTSHIPFILLTAKSGEESKLEGLTAGAEDYITKPFNLDILKVKIRNIIEVRRNNQQVFKQQVKIEPSKIAVSSLDEKLIHKALEYTEKHLSDPDYSVEELSRELGMSRVHLYKKLSSLTGKTPIEFIRIIRLKRAAQLLEESQLTVSEIAYEVGFNNPKYFRKYFKDEFGVLPSQYVNRND
ncbi:hybrid sensor histidine kinase/response regulator transcription factor [Massilibacteroides sp.]|uniref:hybrid sensor histidine kinase/response regulator transcription factor n=1 Tax=Massilibacteroides sp. TaxID=2034766 RepID=UPI00260EE0B8|nr:hybrid sensor histidine kinase/response regulator transcription factor [Massilibacteroides sp.]MDD4516753.1 two-component regulator propeller domain-containing protein [Massilibacteroides sp.]